MTTWPFPYLLIKSYLLTVFLFAKCEGTHFQLLICLIKNARVEKVTEATPVAKSIFPRLLGQFLQNRLEK